jgi:glycine betaine catabolism B
MHWQNAHITRIEPRSPRVKSFFFGLAEPIAFRPGQHVLLRLTAPDGYRAQRSYSIASAPGPGRAEELELAIERLDDGEVSPFMHDVAQVDDEIELGGPIGGHFNWAPEDGGPVLFIAGGSGVAPFMSMLRLRAALRSQVPATLIFSARAREDLLFFDELSTLASDDGFSLMVALTRETAAHPFRAGRIDAAFIAAIIAAMEAPLRHALICGSNPFVETASEGAIAAGSTVREDYSPSGDAWNYFTHDRALSERVSRRHPPQVRLSGSNRGSQSTRALLDPGRRSRMRLRRRRR